MSSRGGLGLRLAPFFVLMPACAVPGGLPGPIAARPIVAAHGHGEVSAWAATDGRVLVSALPTFEATVADGVALRSPISVVVGAPVDDVWSLGARVGLVDVQLRGNELRVDQPDDPRRPVGTLTNFGMVFGGEFITLWRPRPSLRLMGSAGVGLLAFGQSHASLRTKFVLEAAVSPLEALSLQARALVVFGGLPTLDGERYLSATELRAAVVLHVGIVDISGGVFALVGGELLLPLPLFGLGVRP